jgi:hypothetical protein
MNRARFIGALALAICASVLPMRAPAQQPKGDSTRTAAGHYLFAWAGDVEKKGNDFLAVIDADPASPTYGRLITTLATDQKTMQIHHTEYVMPASGMIFANDHLAGRTFIFDVRARCTRRSSPRLLTWPATCIRTPMCGCLTEMSL